MKILDILNEKVNNSVIARFFEFGKRKTNITTEIRGGTATFLAMAYILAVNPAILSASGGPCEGDPLSDAYFACVEEIRKQYVTATALASMIGCFLMGLLANLPIALSCGMGMNAYFTYNVVGWHGFGSVSFQAAVTAVLIEGVIFFLLAVTGARYFIVKLIPEPIRLVTPAAIGIFLAHIGLQAAEGIGVVVSDIATAVTLGGCPPENRAKIVAFTESCKNDTSTCIASEAYTCEGGVLTSATTWVGILGLMIIAVMLSYKKKVAFIVGIAFVTFISWFRNTAITYFPDNDLGNARFAYFSKVVSVEPLDLLIANFTNKLSHIGVALVTFLYIDFLDTSGTLLGIVNSMGLIDDDGNFPGSRRAFVADALATVCGSIFSLSPVTSYVESAAGIEAGARTGFAACICGFYFFLSIFFAPIIASIPPWATGGALVMIGALMCQSLTKVQWHNVPHAITAFIALILMPLTYSIGYALIGGIGCWIILQSVFFLFCLLKIPKPTFEASRHGTIIEKDSHEEKVPEAALDALEDEETIESKKIDISEPLKAA